MKRSDEEKIKYYWRSGGELWAIIIGFLLFLVFIVWLVI